MSRPFWDIAVRGHKSRQVSKTEANRLSVALELQADCYAGVWANRAQYQDLVLEKGDLEEALNAANAIGDDTLQKQAQGYVVPDSFTHGTSAERVQWFRKGMDSGQVSACANPLLPGSHVKQVWLERCIPGDASLTLL